MSNHARVLDALADGTRRDIVDALRGGPRPVGELVAALPVTQPAVSQHLRVLREAGLVAVRKDAQRRVYRLRPEGFAPLRAYVESFWADVLDAYRDSWNEPEEAR